MKVFDKEFYDLVSEFERIFNCKNAKKEPREFLKYGAFYCDGERNKLFWAFYNGYQIGATNYRD